MFKKKAELGFFIGVAVTIMMIVTVLYTFAAGNFETTVFKNSYEVVPVPGAVFNAGQADEDAIDAYPYRFDGAQYRTFTVTATLPETIPEHYAVMIRNNYCGVSIYADDELIGDYGLVQPLSQGHMVGNIRVIRELPVEAAGKTLKIVFYPYYNRLTTLHTIAYGDVNGLKLSVVYDNMWRLVLALILFGVGLICLAITVVTSLYHNYMNRRMFFNLGMFLMYILIWVICSSDLPQLYTNANESISLISFLALSAAGIHYAGYCKQMLSDGEVWFKYTQMTGWLMPLLIIFGFMSGLWDPPEILVINHIYFVILVVLSVFFACRQRHKDFAAGLMLAGIGVLCISVILGLVMFYMDPTSGSEAVCVGIGMVLFGITLFAVILWQQARYLEEQRALSIYKELAYTDNLTGVGNRAAFDAEFSGLHETAGFDTSVALAIFDLNRLKQVNDGIGHYAGDRMIIGAASCLKKAFGEVGHCYRIGGDEFAVVIVGKPGAMEAGMSKLQECIKEFNTKSKKGKEEHLSVAGGYVERLWSNEESFFRVLFHDADLRMYEQKQKDHEQNGNSR